MQAEYTVKKGAVYADKGIPVLPRWVCDNRVSVQIDEYGISAVQYFGILENINIFAADMWGGMKFYINDNEHKSYLDLYETETMPYGYKGKWKYKDNVFLFELRVVNDSIILSISPIEVSTTDLKLSVEFYDFFGLKPNPDADLRYQSTVPRIWHGWKCENNLLYTSFSEGEKETFIAIASNTELLYSRREIEFVKNIIDLGDVTKKQVTMSIAFANDREKAFTLADESANNSVKYIEQQNERYKAVMEKAPVLESQYEELNNFFSLAPLYHEALKLTEFEGATRAKTNIYWIWGWDSMTAASAYLSWGQKDFAEKMLRFFMETADPEGGFMHAYHRDMSCWEVSVIPAQGFYISYLYQYYINGGDIRPFYEFAKKIFGLILSTEVDGLGLCSGYSLVPDFREIILENGNDISCFNNTVAYCAVRALEEMARALGDDETYKKASEFTARTRENFNRLLYDKKVGYYVSSVDSITHEQRPVYMGMEVKWDNPFLSEIVGENIEECLSFFEKEFICKAGIRVFPVHGIGYDADANQAHCWWPVHSEYYTCMINKANRPDLIEQFIGWISNWTRLLTCPEGINCYINTDKPYLDCWNSPQGTWQGYAMRAWYEAVLHSIVGVDVDKEGLNFYPYSGKEMTVKGFHCRDKLVDIHMLGTGAEIEYIEVNGERYEGIRSVSFDMLSINNIIKVQRK